MRGGDGRLGTIAAIAIAAVVVASLSFVQIALASNIDVVGNRLVEADTIRAFFKQSNGRLDAEGIDRALKALYESGLFQDVNISRHDGRIVVKVVENKIIRRVAFEGNKKVKEEQLKQQTQSKERGPLSRATVRRDVQQIMELYRRAGRFDVKVEPKIIAAGEDRADLVFEIQEGQRTGVRQIVFVGNKAFNSSDLRKAIKTGQTHILSFLLDNDLYDPDRVEEDRNQLRRFYLTRGYVDMRVVSAGAQYDPDKKGIVVTFEVDEGERYRVGTVEIRSSLGTVDAAALQRHLRTQEGDVYNANQVEKTIDALSLNLAKSGEPFASVRLRADRVSDRHVVNLIYNIDQGSRLYVERIEIRGNDKTRDDVIRRELEIAEGDAYNRALIERSERRLKNLGYFKVVKITREPGSVAERVVLNVTVEEQPTGNFSIGGGYSTADGFIAQVSVSEKNFLGRGQAIKAAVTFGQYSNGFDVSFVEPAFLGSRVAAGVSVFDRQTIANTDRAYDTLTYGGKLTLGTPLSEDLSSEFRYSLYNQRVTLGSGNGNVSLPIRDAAIAGPLWVSSIGSSLTYNTLDDLRNPRNGIRAIINEDFAGLGGDVNFIRTTADVQYYHELTNDVVGMVRGQGGYIAPWGGQAVPLLNRFFGGPQWVRGFAVNGFGPRDLTPGTTHDNVGGNIYWATTAEVQAAIPYMPPELPLKVAVFADAGSLWNIGSSKSLPALSQSLGNSQAIRSSLGAGLVWDSMFGPIRVDYAYPTSKANHDITKRLHFGAGAFGF
jgi:outer membrane protein insertion porin family